ncbi:histidinol dehydrogenase [Candidatus Micrarchaeota archaeon]|nr:histidinol dehydrogenase [Candidatus Micrarchaeota archaeon]
MLKTRGPPATARYSETVWKNAQPIIQDVQQRGDDAIQEYTQRFDGVKLDPKQFEIPKKVQQDALDKIEPELRKALNNAARRIQAFTEKTRPKNKTWTDEFAGFSWTWTPIESVGCYVPGGKAAYPSTALMTAVPAKTLGCDVTVCTPPNPSAAVLAACALAGADHVFQVGGVQAIAALAYGTKTISRVDKIIGPGGVFVDAAKRLCARDVAIDFPAGPTELLCIAGSDADAKQIALDLLAQAEHDAAARVGLLALDKNILEAVSAELEEQIQKARRATIIKQSLEQNGFAQVVSKTQAIALANGYAFEHVALYGDAAVLKNGIKNAGVIYVGTPPALGDYLLGSSHVLPTNGFAKAFGMLSAYDFLKPTACVKRRQAGLEKDAAAIAKSEGLFGHAQSLEVQRR